MSTSANDRDLCLGHPNAEPDQIPDAQIGRLCLDCWSRLRRTLLELPAVATWLACNLAAGGPPGERVSGTREDPIPLRTDVLDLIGPDSRHYVADEAPRFLLWEGVQVIAEYGTHAEAETARLAAIHAAGFRWGDERAMVRWQVRPTERGGCDQQGVDSFRATVMHWARLICEESGFPWTDRNDLVGLVGWIAGHLSWVVEQPWVDEFMADIRKLSSDAHRVAPWREVTMRDQQPCEACGVRAVVLHVADSLLRCERRMGGCGKTTVSDYLRQATA